MRHLAAVGRHVQEPVDPDADTWAASLEASRGAPAGPGVESEGVGALCLMRATRALAFALVTSPACCADRTASKPAHSGHDPELEAFALLRDRLCAARESNPQPAD